MSGASPITPLDGDSLIDLMRGDSGHWKDEAFSEYLAHGVERPMAMLRRGRYKFNYSLGDSPALYDIETDPGEFTNLANDEAYRSVVEEMQSRLLSHWDPVEIEGRVLKSQRERVLIDRTTNGDWKRFREL
mgnify:CR=1 FL=1